MARAASAIRRTLVEDDLQRMNLPEDFWRVKVTEVAEQVRPTVERFLFRIEEFLSRGVGLILSGGPGVGKTGIASLVCKEARSRGFTAFFVSVWDLRDGIRSRTMFDDEESVLDRCKDVDVLVIDGLRQSDATEPFFKSRDLEELVAFRNERRRMTVVTTRMGKTEIGSFGSLADTAQGRLAFVEVIGPNKREQVQKRLQAEILEVT